MLLFFTSARFRGFVWSKGRDGTGLFFRQVVLFLSYHFGHIHAVLLELSIRYRVPIVFFMGWTGIMQILKFPDPIFDRVEEIH